MNDLNVNSLTSLNGIVLSNSELKYKGNIRINKHNQTLEYFNGENFVGLITSSFKIDDNIILGCNDRIKRKTKDNIIIGNNNGEDNINVNNVISFGHNVISEYQKLKDDNIFFGNNHINLNGNYNIIYGNNIKNFGKDFNNNIIFSNSSKFFLKDSNILIGSENELEMNKSCLIGNRIISKSDSSIIIGINQNHNKNINSVIIGSSFNSSKNCISFKNNLISGDINGSISISNRIINQDLNNICIGFDNKLNQNKNILIGNSSCCNNETKNSICLGTNLNIEHLENNNYNIKIGSNISSSLSSNIILGNKCYGHFSNSIIIGNNINNRINVSELDNNIIFSSNISYISKNNIIIGKDTCTKANSNENSIYLGTQTGKNSKSKNSIFIGSYNNIFLKGNNNISIGLNTGYNYNNDSHIKNSLSIGSNNQIPPKINTFTIQNNDIPLISVYHNKSLSNTTINTSSLGINNNKILCNNQFKINSENGNVFIDSIFISKRKIFLKKKIFNLNFIGNKLIPHEYNFDCSNQYNIIYGNSNIILPQITSKILGKNFYFKNYSPYRNIIKTSGNNYINFINSKKQEIEIGENFSCRLIAISPREWNINLFYCRQVNPRIYNDTKDILYGNINTNYKTIVYLKNDNNTLCTTKSENGDFKLNIKVKNFNSSSKSYYDIIVKDLEIKYGKFKNIGYRISGKKLHEIINNCNKIININLVSHISYYLSNNCCFDDLEINKIMSKILNNNTNCKLYNIRNVDFISYKNIHFFTMIFNVFNFFDKEISYNDIIQQLCVDICTINIYDINYVNNLKNIYFNISNKILCTEYYVLLKNIFKKYIDSESKECIDLLLETTHNYIDQIDLKNIENSIEVLIHKINCL